ncbi:MAG: hypothetical protein ACPGVO_08185 [Spirulinaceae cyanobacterium]
MNAITTQAAKEDLDNLIDRVNTNPEPTILQNTDERQAVSNYSDGALNRNRNKADFHDLFHLPTRPTVVALYLYKPTTSLRISQHQCSP